MIRTKQKLQNLCNAGVKFTVGAGADLKLSRPRNLKAYEYFLKGIYHLQRRNQQDVLTAGKMFEEAINFDPNFGAAYRWLGFVHTDEVWFRITKSPEKTLEQAEQAAQRAIALTPDLPPPYPLLSQISLLKRDFDNAILYGEKAIEFSRNEAGSYFVLGMALRNAGRFEEAVMKIETALRLAPLRPLNFINNLASGEVSTLLDLRLTTPNALTVGVGVAQAELGRCRSGATTSCARLWTVSCQSRSFPKRCARC